MSDKRRKFEPDEHTPIQIDAMGVKAKLQPVADEAMPPPTWQEVGRRINLHLMTLVESPFSVPAAVVIGVNNLVRGVGAMFTRRVEDAHSEADRREDQREEALIEREAQAGPVPIDSHNVAKVVERLEDLLNEFRAKGLAVEIRDLGNDRVGLYLLPPEQLEAAYEIVEQEVVPALDADSTISLETLRMLRAELEATINLDDRRELLKHPLPDLKLSTRVRKALDQLGLKTVGDLVQKTADDLLATPNFGRKSLEEVRTTLASVALSLRGE